MSMRGRTFERGAWLVGAILVVGCGAPCEDDPLHHGSCARGDGGGGGTGTSDALPGSSGDEGTQGADGGAAEGGGGGGGGGGTSGQGSGGTPSLRADTGDADAGDADSGNADSGDTDGSAPVDAGSGWWCLDADGDGFGDPTECIDHFEPGRVDDDTDCNDADPYTFPGAAEAEPDPAACATDADEDGWGDTTPSDGAVAGADCWDDEPLLNPALVQVGTAGQGPLGEGLALVDHLDATLSVVAPLDTPVLGWSVSAAALRRPNEVIVMDMFTGHLQRIEYMDTCGGATAGTATSFGSSFGDTMVCGLSFDADDRLWGIDMSGNAVLELDPDTGAVLSSTPLEAGGVPLEVDECDLTWDCHGERLLLAHGAMNQVLALDPATGQTTVVAEYTADPSPTGIAYDPVDRMVWVSSGAQLGEVPLDGTAATQVGQLSYDGGLTTVDVADLALLQTCGAP